MRDPIRFIVRGLRPTGSGGTGGVPNPVPLAGRVRSDNRQFVNAAGIFRPVFASQLSLLRPDRSDANVQQVLDWTAATGFNGIRVFAGTLLWAGQSAEWARTRLPFVLDETRRRGLYVEVTALTDTAHVAIDKPAHVDAIAALCAEHDHTLLELANEYWHPTQDDEVHDLAYLDRLYRFFVRPREVTCALGAPDNGTPWEDLLVADYHTHRLERRSDPWDMVRRVREFEELSGVLTAPVMNNEPIGADEQDDPGRRLADPSVFLTMGALNRIFEAGGVFHFQAGLHAQLPGPVQQACAEAFIRGSRLIPVEDRLRFINGHWDDSPVSVDFSRVRRAYTGVAGGAGDRAWTVLVGISKDPESGQFDPKLAFRNGWQLVETLVDAGAVRVLALAR